MIANQGNPKSHWKSINNILGKSTDEKNCRIELKPNCSNIPEQFNEHFMKAGGQTAECIGNEFLDYLNHSPNFSMFLFPSTNEEI